MEVEVTCTVTEQNIKIVKIMGSMNVNTSEKVQQDIAVLMGQGDRMAVDLSECVYVSSSGLRTLLLTAKKAKSKQAKVIFAAATAEVKDVLEMTGFSRILECVDTVDEALQKLR